MPMGYWAVLDGDEAASPVAMLGETSAVDAAGAYAQQLVEATEGGWTEGAIRVWDAKQGPQDAVVFDVTASFAVSEDDEDAVDCELEILERD